MGGGGGVVVVLLLKVTAVVCGTLVTRAGTSFVPFRRNGVFAVETTGRLVVVIFDLPGKLKQLLSQWPHLPPPVM